MAELNAGVPELVNADNRRSRRSVLRPVLLISGLALLVATTTVVAVSQDAGVVEYEVRSAFSHIRVRRAGNVRTLIFVRDTGEEAYESQMNMRAPHALRFNYLKHMFSSYLIQPRQERVLIVGLGGGSMVHFLRKYDPEITIDAVEIDPVVVQIAERFFALKAHRRTKLIVADAFDYFARNSTRYDTIYMDAFLKPSESTDETGVPLRLRTLEFYRQLQDRLNPGGSVVFNINPHSEMREDLMTIAEAFPQSYVFNLPGSEGVVVLASTRAERTTESEIRAAGAALDQRFKAEFSFETIATHLRRDLK